jgi:hypothetical protein
MRMIQSDTLSDSPYRLVSLILYRIVSYRSSLLMRPWWYQTDNPQNPHSVRRSGNIRKFGPEPEVPCLCCNHLTAASALSSQAYKMPAPGKQEGAGGVYVRQTTTISNTLTPKWTAANGLFQAKS